MEIQHIYIPSVYTNCYLLCDEESKSFAVIDPGADITADIQQFCQESGYTLRAIFLTHSHYDHIGGVAALRQAFPDVPAYIHPDDTGRYDARIPTSTLGPLPHQGFGGSPVSGRPLYRRHPLCRHLRPHRLPRRGLRGDDGLPKALGGTGGELPGAAGP